MTAILTRVGIVGELNPAFPPHVAVNANLDQARSHGGLAFTADWIGTEEIARAGPGRIAAYNALWISPGSPYRNTEGALAAIEYARTSQVPVLGTCGGFQHLILEFGINVLGMRDATHEEMDPGTGRHIVTALACSPAGTEMPVTLDPGSAVASIYGRTRTVERYYCNYGLNPEFAPAVHAHGLRIVGRDDAGEPRVVELDNHPFFIGALYVPQPSAAETPCHPLIRGLIVAAIDHAQLSATAGQ